MNLNPDSNWAANIMGEMLNLQHESHNFLPKAGETPLNG